MMNREQRDSTELEPRSALRSIYRGGDGQGGDLSDGMKIEPNYIFDDAPAPKVIVILHREATASGWWIG